MEAIRIDSILFSNGNEKNCKRTIMSETGLAPETLVQYVGRQSRWTGTGYVNHLYRIVGTDDLLVIRHNDGYMDNLHCDNVELVKDHFHDSRSYAKRVGILSRKYRIPFKVCLALGDDESVYAGFVDALKNLDSVSIGTMRDLVAGIYRRKAGLLSVLGEELYEAIGIDGMGQTNSSRIAGYVNQKCEERLFK